MNIGITGSTSNLAIYINKYFKSKKIKIIKINKNEFNLEKTKKYNFKKKKIKVLIHLSHSYKGNGLKINYEGSKRLFSSAKKNNVKKIIFISSISSHKNALSQYGKTKFKIENYCKKNKIIIIRPGLIYGFKKDKKIQLMENIVKFFPIIPYFKNNKKFLYSVHIGELVKNIYKIAISKKTKNNYNIFSKKKIYFEDLINLNYHKKVKVLLPYFLWHITFILISKILYLKSIDSFLGILGNRIKYENHEEKLILTKRNLIKDNL